MHGHLSTFLYAFPILHRSLGSNVRANCLRNSDSFPTVMDYLSEYQLITSKEMLQELCDIMIFVGENKNYVYPMADYTIYAWSNPNPQRPYSGLLERRQFIKWFYGLFFRLALPYEQNLGRTTKIIWSPLNMSIIFRLIAHLHGIRYPAHWLSEPFLNILSKTITTSARPPHKKPMRPSDLKVDQTEKKLCTAPFAPELAALASIFQPILPFSVPSSSIPDVNDVHKFTFTFESYQNYLAGISCLFLVFIDPSFITNFDTQLPVLMRDIRKALDPATKAVGFDELREKGLVVWSTCEWNEDKREMSAWIDESIVERLSEIGGGGRGRWAVGVWRSDIWSCVTVPLSEVKEVIRKGERWGGGSDMPT